MNGGGAAKRGLSKFFVKCWNCPRHFMGEAVLAAYDDKCNICGAELDRKENRV
jgi:rRNA maturation endonuclease Nob1